MAELKEQQTIPGAADNPSRKVRDAARAYAKAVYQRMKLQEDEAVLRPSLDEKMEEEDCHKLEVSFKTDTGEAVRYQVTRGAETKVKITCKKLAEEKEGE